GCRRLRSAMPQESTGISPASWMGESTSNEEEEPEPPQNVPRADTITEADARRAALLIPDQRADLKSALLSELFPRQRGVATSKRMFTALLCGRRSGKTIAIVYMIVLALIEAASYEHVVYTPRFAVGPLCLRVRCRD